MALTRQQARDYIRELRQTLGEFDTNWVRAYVLPAFTALDAVREAMGDYPVEIGSQNVNWADQGAFTGEISSAMVVEVGCTMTMIGHSERRFLFGETDETVAKRVQAAYRHDLTPLVCIGETLEERDAGRTADVLRRQFQIILQDMPLDFLPRVLFLYEPRWAIGAKEPAPLDYIQSTHTLMRELLSQVYGEQIADSISLVYGGSVTLENLESILQLSNVDGCGVGRASWSPVDFAKMVRVTEKVAFKKIKGQ